MFSRVSPECRRSPSPECRLSPCSLLSRRPTELLPPLPRFLEIPGQIRIDKARQVVLLVVEPLREGGGLKPL